MTKLEEYLLQEQTNQELKGVWSNLKKIATNINSATTDVKNLRKTSKAIAGKELKNLEDGLKKIADVAQSAVIAVGRKIKD